MYKWVCVCIYSSVSKTSSPDLTLGKFSMEAKDCKNMMEHGLLEIYRTIFQAIDTIHPTV